MQLLHVISPEILFRHYVYVSGTSSAMREHLRDYAQTAKLFCPVSDDQLVLEFGSNDGTLLRYFKDEGNRVLGVDPAENLAKVATASGIHTLPKFFNPETALEILNTHGKAKLICANHCCAHIDDFLGVVEGVKILLSETGVWIFEVGYLYDVYKKSLFDTVYHEHLDFHTLAPLISCFRQHGLQILHASRHDIQGGALRCYVGWKDTAPVIEGGTKAVQDLLELETSAGMHMISTFERWNESIRMSGIELRSLLTGLKNAGKRIAAYGAPAKATTLMYHFGITKDDIEFIVDDNPLKQNLISPGLHIPVVAASTLYHEQPDYVLILAWNFADDIMKNHNNFLQDGRRFIIPLPHLRVVG